jgi:hypothetical protein
MMGRFQYQVSYYVLDKIYEQSKIVMEKYINHQTGECTGDFAQQFGLPCRHMIVGRLQTIIGLTLNDVDWHWWLRKAGPIIAEEVLNKLLKQYPHILPRRQRNGNDSLPLGQYVQGDGEDNDMVISAT